MLSFSYYNCGGCVVKEVVMIDGTLGRGRFLC